MFGKEELITRIDYLREENSKLKEGIKSLTFDLECKDIKQRLLNEEALAKLRKEIQEALIKSDLLRVAAESKLDAYLKMDNKDESKRIMDMLDKSVQALSTRAQVSIVK